MHPSSREDRVLRLFLLGIVDLPLNFAQQFELLSEIFSNPLSYRVWNLRFCIAVFFTCHFNKSRFIIVPVQDVIVQVDSPNTRLTCWYVLQLAWLKWPVMIYSQNTCGLETSFILRDCKSDIAGVCWICWVWAVLYRVGLIASIVMLWEHQSRCVWIDNQSDLANGLLADLM